MHCDRTCFSFSGFSGLLCNSAEIQHAEANKSVDFIYDLWLSNLCSPAVGSPYCPSGAQIPEISARANASNLKWELIMKIKGMCLSEKKNQTNNS